MSVTVSSHTETSDTHARVKLQPATQSDVPRLIEMMHALYKHDGLPALREDVARSGIQKMLLDPASGGIYLIMVGEEIAGYVVLTVCFSIEFHGKFGLLDEIYVCERFRRRGLAGAAVERVEAICREMSLHDLRLEVAQNNQAAQSLYDSLGFHRETRYLYSKRI